MAIEVESRLAGGIGLDLRSNEFAGTAAFGYWVARELWGRGIASSAVEVFVPYAFDTFGLHRVDAKVCAPNRASARVLEKSGFSCEGLNRLLHTLRDGSVCDTVRYARLNMVANAPANPE